MQLLPRLSILGIASSPELQQFITSIKKLKQIDMEHLFNQDPDKNKSGLFDLPNTDYCTHPEHNPPSHMVIPQGKGYKHVCPACGKQQIVIPQQIRF